MITAMNFFLSIKRFNILNFRLYKNFHILVFKGMKDLSKQHKFTSNKYTGRKNHYLKYSDVEIILFLQLHFFN